MMFPLVLDLATAGIPVAVTCRALEDYRPNDSYPSS